MGEKCLKHNKIRRFYLWPTTQQSMECGLLNDKYNKKIARQRIIGNSLKMFSIERWMKNLTIVTHSYFLILILILIMSGLSKMKGKKILIVESISRT